MNSAEALARVRRTAERYGLHIETRPPAEVTQRWYPKQHLIVVPELEEEGSAYEAIHELSHYQLAPPHYRNKPAFGFEGEPHPGLHVGHSIRSDQENEEQYVCTLDILHARNLKLDWVELCIRRQWLTHSADAVGGFRALAGSPLYWYACALQRLGFADHTWRPLVRLRGRRERLEKRALSLRYCHCQVSDTLSP